MENFVVGVVCLVVFIAFMISLYVGLNGGLHHFI